MEVIVQNAQGKAVSHQTEVNDGKIVIRLAPGSTGLAVDEDGVRASEVYFVSKNDRLCWKTRWNGHTNQGHEVGLYPRSIKEEVSSMRAVPVSEAIDAWLEKKSGGRNKDSSQGDRLYSDADTGRLSPDKIVVAYDRDGDYSGVFDSIENARKHHGHPTYEPHTYVTVNDIARPIGQAALRRVLSTVKNQ